MSALKETKPENKEALNNIPDNINDAFQIYVQTSSRKLNNIAQQEIGRMIRWLGDKRSISGITPSEIGNYSDEFAKRTSVATVAQKVNYLKKFLLFLKLNELTALNLASHLRMKKSNVGKITKKLEETKREEINLTEAGYKDLEKQLKELNDQRPRLADEVRRAIKDGDAEQPHIVINKPIFDVVNVLSGNSYSIDELVEVLARLTRAKPKIERMMLPKGDPEKSYGTVEKMFSILGIRSSRMTTLELGLRKIIENTF